MTPGAVGATAAKDHLRQDGHVSLRLIEVPSGFNHVDDSNFRQDWWERLPRPSQHSWSFSVADDEGAEVARVYLLDRTDPGGYVGVAATQDYLKIQLIEVHARHRRQGIGIATLDLLASRYPRRRLIAFSENDAFWQSTGWSRHVHEDFDPDYPRRYQELFIQP